ncbi:MAG: asparagine synthase C-terminal domain-containing protein, partial [Nanoarchaeota archaeon]
GIDSSTIVQIASKLKNEPIKTFSVGFGKEKDLENARLVSDYFNTEHTEIIIEPKAIELLPKIIWHFDEPLADPAAIPTYVLSEKTKKKATVCLVGEGADEVFGGYEQYKIMKLGKYGKIIPLPIRKKVPDLVNNMPKSLLNKFFKYSESLGEKGIERFKTFLENLNDETSSYLNLVTIFDKNDLEEFGDEKLNKHYEDLVRDFSFYFNKNNSLLNKNLDCEVNTSLCDNLLMKVDKMTMAHAVEARVPFLDHRLVELMSKVKSNLKLNGLKDKYLLRKTMKNKLPKQIYGAKKERFFVPIDEWINRDLKELTNQVLDNSILVKKKLAKKEYFEKMRKFRDKSKLYYARQMWNILNFELWYKIFIENENINKAKLNLNRLI